VSGPTNGDAQGGAAGLAVFHTFDGNGPPEVRAGRLASCHPILATWTSHGWGTKAPM
jgi:hypothetical protein